MNRRSASALLSTSLVLFAMTMVTAPASASVDFGTVIPAEEIRLDGALTQVSAQDRLPLALGNVAGEVCVMAREGFALRSLRSANNGATFAAEVAVAPGLDVQTFAASLGVDGVVYAALVVADAQGGLGLVETHSGDMCQSWSSPQTIVTVGDQAHSVEFSLAVAANASGRAAIAFSGNDGLNAYAVASVDGGSSWTAPVRIDAGAALHTYRVPAIDVTVDDGGSLGETIHVAFQQARGGQTEVWYTRSSDGGATFSAETAVSASSGAVQHADPELAIAADGSVLLALWGDDGTNGRSYVLRSTNQGTGWSISQNVLIQSRTDPPFRSALTPSSDDGEVLLTVPAANADVGVYRSTDHGATFALETTLTSVENHSATRTSSDAFVVAWSEARDDAYAGYLTDVFAISSTGCCSWSTEQRVDGDAPGAARSVVGQIAASGTDDVFFPLLEGRGDGSRAFDIWGNRSSASALSFAADYRIDSDAGTECPASANHPALAADGGTHVYVATATVATGPHPDVLVAVSSDGGYTYGTPVRIGDTAPGQTIDWWPVVSATPDGYVYVVYLSDAADGSGREVRFNRSADFGATWLPADVVLASLAGHPSGYGVFPDYPVPSLAAVNGGRVYVAWSDGATVFLARSSDGGSSFATDDVDQSGSGLERFPRICAQGNQVVLVWRGPDLAQQYWSVWGSVSDDGAVSWASRTQLRPEAVGNGADLPALACDGGSAAVAAWPDFRTAGTARMRVSRYDGASWLGDTPVTGPGGPDHRAPRVAFSNATDALLVYENESGQVYINRSTDGGSSFVTATARLDSASPDPSLDSTEPRILTDGGGNAWAVWLDGSAGQLSLVARHSSDDGATFGPVTRISRDEPAGGFLNSYTATTTFDTLPGTALLTWAGERDSAYFSVLAGAWDLSDLDRDRSDAGVDCDDGDPYNWTACATCNDDDGDDYYELCDVYDGVLGPDCDDSDPNNWVSCATCDDGDADGFYVQCDAYVTLSGPDCDDGVASCSSDCTDYEYDGLADCAEHELVEDLGTGGTWHYDSGSWDRLSTWDPEQTAAWENRVVVNYGVGRGLWAYEAGGWTKLRDWVADDFVAWGDTLAVDFGAAEGIWKYTGGVWSRLSTWDPLAMVAWNDKLVVDFGPGRGVWTYDGAWSRIASWLTERMLAWGSELVADFGATYGLWSYDGAWKRMTTWDADLMSTRNGDLIVQFTLGRKMWTYDGVQWKLLTDWVAEQITGWGERLAVDFGAARGLWSYDTVNWKRATTWDPEGFVAAGSILSVDFGASGLWSYDLAAWNKLTTLDTDGQETVNLNP